MPRTLLQQEAGVGEKCWKDGVNLLCWSVLFTREKEPWTLNLQVLLIGAAGNGRLYAGVVFHCSWCESCNKGPLAHCAIVIKGSEWQKCGDMDVMVDWLYDMRWADAQLENMR